jgi:nitrogen regulatory protein PII 2
MKQIIAIIRDECAGPSQAALARAGISGIVIFPVMGRGQQKGAAVLPDSGGTFGRNAGHHLRRGDSCTAWPAYQPPRKKKTGFGFLPKQMLIFSARDEVVTRAVNELLEVCQSGRHGDGKIFVCPVAQVSPGDESGQRNVPDHCDKHYSVPDFPS